MSSRPSDDDAARVEKYHEQAHRALAESAVAKWNAELQSWRWLRYSPTIGVALAARFYFLDVWCPGCQRAKQVDLRKVDRDRKMRIEGLIPSLSCRACRPSPPFARLLGLSARPRDAGNPPVSLPKTRP